ncbi:hypothetical protein GCM10023176_44480 [Micromonospora coerulea]|uniref:Uncharacterized protein n=1 Tax=Micromonospora coerulea TaxID=47856 RepID=A0ABP8SUZ4_9ACTN
MPPASLRAAARPAAVDAVGAPDRATERGRSDGDVEYGGPPGAPSGSRGAVVGGPTVARPRRLTSPDARGRDGDRRGCCVGTDPG